MTPPQKICPKCQAVAPIDAPICRNCAHAFRTQFAPPLGQTQAVSPQPVLSHPSPPYQPQNRFQHHVATKQNRFIVTAVLTTAGAVGALFLLLMVSAALSMNGEKNRPGHIVSIGEAETLTPLCSEHQVLETLGAPVQNVNDIWSYPAEGGDIVGVKFGDNGGVRGVQAIVITDANGAVIWRKD